MDSEFNENEIEENQTETATDILTVIPKQDDILQCYLKEIGKIELVKSEEEKAEAVAEGEKE